MALVDPRDAVPVAIHLNCCSFICCLASSSAGMLLSMPMRAMKWCEAPTSCSQVCTVLGESSTGEMEPCVPITSEAMFQYFMPL